MPYHSFLPPAPTARVEWRPPSTGSGRAPVRVETPQFRTHNLTSTAALRARKHLSQHSTSLVHFRHRQCRVDQHHQTGLSQLPRNW